MYVGGAAAWLRMGTMGELGPPSVLVSRELSVEGFAAWFLRWNGRGKERRRSRSMAVWAGLME